MLFGREYLVELGDPARKRMALAIGGAAYLVSKAIRAARLVAFEDLGMEAVYEFTVDDPKIFTKPWTESLQMKLHPEWEKVGLYEFFCLENNRCPGGDCSAPAGR